MSVLPRLLVVAALLIPAACQRAAQPTAETPSEPFRMVYTLASPSEVVMLDLNSITRTGDVAETWSLTFLAQPVKFDGAPREAQVYWMRSRLDCAARTGQFTQAVGVENGRQAFAVPVDLEPTPMAAAWPLDEEFVCNNLQGARTAATTFLEAAEAARTAMNPLTHQGAPGGQSIVAEPVLQPAPQ